MDSVQILSTLYDLALVPTTTASSSELIRLMIQRLMYHTGFPCGLFLSAYKHDESGKSYLVDDIICGKSFNLMSGSVINIENDFLKENKITLKDESFIKSNFDNNKYKMALCLPVNTHNAFFLFSHSDIPPEMPWETIFPPVLNSFGKSLELYINIENVHKRLEENELRTRTVLDNIADAVITIDESGNIAFFNKSAENMFRYREEEVIGKPIETIMPASEADKHAGYMSDYLQTGNAKVIGKNREFIAVRKGGLEFPMEIKVTEIVIKGQKLFTGIIRDISDQKYNQEKLLYTNEILNNIAFGENKELIIRKIINMIEHLSPGVLSSILFLEDEHLVNGIAPSLPDFYNSAIEGLKIGDKVGSCGTAAWRGERVIVKDIDNHPYWKNFLTLTQKANLHACWSEPIKSSDNDVIGTLAMYYHEAKEPSSIEIDLIETSAKLAAVVIQRDEYVNSLEKARKDAEKANRAKSEFLSSMSHELRTPLNAVLGFAQLLELDDLTASQQESVSEIIMAGEHLLTLINEILDLAKVESGKIELNIETFNLAQLLEESISLVQPLNNRDDISITMENIDEGAEVTADRFRTKQVIMNLLSNAIKYNRKNGSVIIHTDTKNDKNLKVYIVDTGPGLKEEEINKLFKPFERLSAEFSGIEGTGIGLTICKQLVEMMNGEIGVESKLGEGSVFWIQLPVTTA